MPGSSKNNKFNGGNVNASKNLRTVKKEVINLDNNSINEMEEFLDPYCLEKSPQKINFQDVTSAAFLIKGGVEKTPCFVSMIYSHF